MFRLVLLSALVALAISQDDSCCSMEDRKAVLRMWESVWSAEFTGRRLTIAKNAFQIMFDQYGVPRELFTRVNVENTDSPEFKSHMIRVCNGLDTIINMLFDSDMLEEQLIHLGNQHTHYEGMKKSYLQDFRNAFSRVLPQAVPCFDKSAWDRCITFMQDKIGSALSG